MRAVKFLIPLAIFLGIAWFLLQGLGKDPRELPSPLIGKPAPSTPLPLLAGADTERWSPDKMRGKVWLLNVWGSWCAGCKVEHPVVMALAGSSAVPIVGMAWKDRPEDARAWLARLGDPYALNVLDLDGRAAIDWGVYGAPETFVIDRNGIIRDKFVGALTPEAVSGRLQPLLTRLQSE